MIVPQKDAYRARSDINNAAWVVELAVLHDDVLGNRSNIESSAIVCMHVQTPMD